MEDTKLVGEFALPQTPLNVGVPPPNPWPGQAVTGRPPGWAEGFWSEPGQAAVWPGHLFIEPWEVAYRFTHKISRRMLYKLCLETAWRPSYDLNCNISFDYTLPYYTVLDCIVLDYTVLDCTVAYHTFLQCILLHHAILYYILLCYTVLFYTILYCIIVDRLL